MINTQQFSFYTTFFRLLSLYNEVFLIILIDPERAFLAANNLVILSERY